MKGVGAFPHLEWAARTDVGRVRTNNEDSLGTFPEHGFWCVADGMGGGEDGELASSTLVRLVGNLFHSLSPRTDTAYAMDELLDDIREAVADANDVIYRRAKTLALRSCGSTFAGVCFNAAFPQSAITIGVGDSRVYRVRGAEIEQITHDHTLGASLGLKETDIPHRLRGVLSRAVGVEAHVEVETLPFVVEEGDRVLICSDGLTRLVDDATIAAIASSGEDVESIVSHLVDSALDAGGVDNVTAILIRVGCLPPPLEQRPVGEEFFQTCMTVA